jgi:hypothetical protein
VRRPRTWTASLKVIVTEQTYDMLKLHRMVKRCIKGTSAEVKKVEIRSGLIEETGLRGLAFFDKKTILVDEHNGNQIQLLLSILHEIFHYYFRDYNDYRATHVHDDVDPIEIRAETSARNMLKWYIENEKQLHEVINLISKIEIKKLTSMEKEEL